jgi:hypothetical protein
MLANEKKGAIQQSLAVNGAIAFVSSSFLLPGLNADRAPQLKAIIRLLASQKHLTRLSRTNE